MLPLSTPLLAALTFCSAAFAIFGNLSGQPWLVWLCKPLTTLLIIAHAWPRGRGEAVPRRWVLLGLVFSLAGDVALMGAGDAFFMVGLLSFLLAHLCYLWAFTRVARLAAWPWSFLLYALLAGGILSQLWPGVPAELRPPVIAYVLCLAAMGAQTAVLWRRGAPRGAVLALGGLLFVVSDALLATNKFAGPLPLASLWVLSSYWAAQWCIASWLAPAVPARGVPSRLTCP
jgi:uncharacterized membrane protein YhhN